MSLTLFGLEKCSTCKKARVWLAEHAIDHTFVDYREQPIAAPQLVAWAEALGGWPKLVNRASMTWRNLPEARKAPADDAAWTALIAEYPALVRRPVAWDGETVSAGFSEKKFGERFGA
ncbi:MAG: Spx/MgsR family RNA polymerase-binding regulatory protein [Pseudomonadota bacterium]